MKTMNEYGSFMENTITECAANKGWQSGEEFADHQFVVELNRMAEKIYANAKAKGFYDNPRDDGTALMLVTSELAEVLEGLRDGNPPSEKIGSAGYSQGEEEVADAIIRLLDFGKHKGWDVGGAIIAKMGYNAKREYLHGRKF